MDMQQIPQLLLTFLEISALLFIFVIGLIVLWIKVIASGKLITPAEAAWALCVGADFITSARGFMFALGCRQALQCNRNTCPTGITTHDKKPQAGLDPQDKAERVRHYAQNMVHEIGVIAHSCGVRGPRELRRHHARIVTADGRSIPLDGLYPDHSPIAQPLAQYPQ